MTEPAPATPRDAAALHQAHARVAADPDAGGPQESPVYQYTLDEVGNRTSVRAGGQSVVQGGSGRLTQFTYDSLNRLASTTDAEGGVWKTEYDAAGRVVPI